MAKEDGATERWVTCLFKGSRVLARADERDEPLVDAAGRVDIVYRPGGRVYRASRRNLKVDRSEADAGQTERKREKTAAAPGAGSAGAPRSRARPAGAQLGNDAAAAAVAAAAAGINRRGRASQKGAPAGDSPPEIAELEPLAAGKAVIWTDGACLGNPGPAGAGVLLQTPSCVREISRFLGTGTNNIGELTAVLIALEELDDPDADVVLYTDSTYVIGVLTKPWKPKKNLELIESIKETMRRFRRLKLRKVAGHAGVMENERVDWLARRAAQTRSDLDRVL